MKWMNPLLSVKIAFSQQMVNIPAALDERLVVAVAWQILRQVDGRLSIKVRMHVHKATDVTR